MGLGSWVLGLGSWVLGLGSLSYCYYNEVTRSRLLIYVALGFALAGCGGGGASGGGDTAVTQTLNGYGLSATYQAAPGVKPQSSNGAGSAAAFTALFGVSFTAVQTNQVPDINNTKIAFNRNGYLWVMDATMTHQTPVGTDFPVNNNSCEPAIQPGGRVAAITRYDTGTGHFQIYFVALDGSSSTKVTSLAGDCTSPTWNPNGTVCVFVSQVGGAYELFSIPAGGGAPTNLSNNSSVSDALPVFSRDGTKIYFWRYNIQNAIWNSFEMNANGSGQTAAQFGSFTTVRGAALSPSGNLYVVSNGTSLYRLNMLGIGGLLVLAPNGHAYTNPSFSPDGQTILFEDDANGISNLATVRFDGVNPQDVTFANNANNGYDSPSWGPFPQNRQVVGPSGTVATGASGFLVGQLLNSIVSFVAFTATTPASASVVPQAQTADNCVFELKGDSITKLAFVNDLATSATTVVPVSGLSSIGGALVSFNGATGRVVSVIPYSPGAPKRAAGKNGTLVYTGRFLGIYDGSGRNLAPGGASRVEIDGRTGQAGAF